jgi:hypothetical protein
LLWGNHCGISVERLCGRGGGLRWRLGRVPHFNGFDSVVAGLLFFMIPLCGLGMWLSGSLTRLYYDAWQKERMLEEVNEGKQ